MAVPQSFETYIETEVELSKSLHKWIESGYYLFAQYGQKNCGNELETRRHSPGKVQGRHSCHTGSMESIKGMPLHGRDVDLLWNRAKNPEKG